MGGEAMDRSRFAGIQGLTASSRSSRSESQSSSAEHVAIVLHFFSMGGAAAAGVSLAILQRRASSLA